MSDWGQFFAMGGYGDYVWSAYLVVAVTLVANIWVPLRSRVAVLRRLRALGDKPAPAAGANRAASAPRPARTNPNARAPRGATRTGNSARNKPKTARKGK